ncbi:MAG: hypothetical protein ACRD9W_00380 [Terriglobia bacterium]
MPAGRSGHEIAAWKEKADNDQRLLAMRIVLIAALCGFILLFTGVPLAAQSGGGEASEPLAYVTVVGAPGDGEQALAAALSRQLASREVKEATAFQGNVYEVQGTVRVAPAARGKQNVTIVWVVLGPDGTQLGITRQSKDVRKGSLDKKWDGAAEAAAAAAAADIVNLIPH